MTSQLLYVPLRRTCHVPIGYGIERYVQTEFHHNEGQVTLDADALDKLRNKILETPPHISSLEVLFE